MKYKYPEYDDLSNILFEVNIFESSSFMHGLLCAYVCLGISFDVSKWLEGKNEGSSNLKREKSEFSEDQAIDILNQLSSSSYKYLIDDEMIFPLLLPGDDEELPNRTRALSYWCEGFMSIFGDFRHKSFFSKDVIETLSQIEEIIEIDFDNVEQIEQNERAFFDIVEYVRMSVLLIFLELRNNIDKNKQIQELEH